MSKVIYCPTVSTANFVNRSEQKKAREVCGLQYHCTFILVIWTSLYSWMIITNIAAKINKIHLLNPIIKKEHAIISNPALVKSDGTEAFLIKFQPSLILQHFDLRL